MLKPLLASLALILGISPAYAQQYIHNLTAEIEQCQSSADFVKQAVIDKNTQSVEYLRENYSAENIESLGLYPDLSSQDIVTIYREGTHSGDRVMLSCLRRIVDRYQ